jgi:hypothetical protein
MRNQPYEAKVRSLGLAPNIPKHFWQLLKGDAGAGSSIFRRATLFQQLAAPGARTAATMYSKAIQLATMRAKDQRPRYWQVSLLGIGRVIETNVPIGPVPDDEILRTAPGVAQGEPTVFPVARGVPLISTTKFRIMVHDESGQRYFDVDCMGTRSLNLYGWGVTVFALIKEEGYEVDRQGPEQEQFVGMLDQAIVGARVLPIRSNFTQNPQNRTVTVSLQPPDQAIVIPIPPGSKRVQMFCLDGAARFLEIAAFMQNIDPINSGASGSVGNMGRLLPELGKASTPILRVADANTITLVRITDNSSLWTLVFEETP